MRVATLATLVILGMLTTLPPGGFAPLRAQSLAELAKKEEDRRKQLRHPGKVYTNKDLGSVPPSAAVPPSDPAAAPGGETASGGAKEPARASEPGKADDNAASNKDKDKSKDPAFWAGRKKALQDALDRDTTFADALQSKINALTTDFVNRDDPAQRAIIQRNRQKALADLEGLKKQIVADKKALADFEEEARRVGVPPGWLR